MASPFDYSWHLLKARAEHQLFMDAGPRRNLGQKVGPMWWTRGAQADDHAMSLGTVHPAVMGKLERQGGGHGPDLRMSNVQRASDDDHDQRAIDYNPLVHGTRRPTPSPGSPFAHLALQGGDPEWHALSPEEKHALFLEQQELEESQRFYNTHPNLAEQATQEIGWGPAGRQIVTSRYGL